MQTLQSTKILLKQGKSESQTLKIKTRDGYKGQKHKETKGEDNGGKRLRRYTVLNKIRTI